LAYAEEFGHEKQEALVEELFVQYLSQEQWLSREILAAAALKVGIPDATAFLDDETAGLDLVHEHLQQVKDLEIQSVPSFIIGGTIVKGSQTQDEYERLIMAALDSAQRTTE
jgi:predicted DsbA family dithiol-disulfide isomerase